MDGLAERQVHMETRLAVTELVAVASAVGLVTEELRGMRAERRQDRARAPHADARSMSDASGSSRRRRGEARGLLLIRLPYAFARGSSS